VKKRTGIGICLIFKPVPVTFYDCQDFKIQLLKSVLLMLRTTCTGISYCYRYSLLSTQSVYSVTCDTNEGSVTVPVPVARSLCFGLPGGGEEEQETVDLLDIASRFLSDFDLLAEARLVARENTLGVERRKKTTAAKKSAIEAKAQHAKNIISTFKAGGTVHLRSHRGGGFGRSGGGGGGVNGGGGSFGRPDAFRARPPNTSRPPSLHVDDFLVLELKGQQPTGPTGYNKQSIRAAKELFAQREAEAAAAGLKPPQQLREATRQVIFCN